MSHFNWGLVAAIACSLSVWALLYVVLGFVGLLITVAVTVAVLLAVTLRL